MIGCGYCPARHGMFKFIKMHYTQQHENVPFLLVRHRNPEQCILCLYSSGGGDLVNHFHQMHSTAVSCDDIVFNPTVYTPGFLAEMLRINVHRRFQCGICGAVFETEHEIKWHTVHMHGDSMDWRSVMQQSNALNGILYVVCSKCHQKIQPNELLEHMIKESHAGAIYSDLMKVVVVFANGLTVFKQNLMCSVYDDTQTIIQRFQNGH